MTRTLKWSPMSQSMSRTHKADAARRERRRHNPFVEYEDREMRLQDEIRWLQEDSAYLDDRRDELRFNNVQRGLDIRESSSEHLFENAVIYSDYSPPVRTSTALKEELRRRREETGLLREFAVPKIQRLKAAMALQRSSSGLTKKHEQLQVAPDL